VLEFADGTANVVAENGAAKSAKEPAKKTAKKPTDQQTLF
jgi:hypothetical protein